jgi:hypothetical protein
MKAEIATAIAQYSKRVSESEDTDYPGASAEAIEKELRKFFESTEGRSLRLEAAP